MKFTIAVVILAVALCSDAGFVPTVIDVSANPWDAPWANSWGHHGPVAYGPYGPSLAVSHQALAYSPYGPSLAVSPGHYGPYGSPYSAYVPAAVSGHGHEAKYVAANRGSVHVAPLVGHAQSVSSSNLQPAPGTTW